MPSECNKDTIGKLKPLPGDNEEAYLVPLHFRKPKTIFGGPLYIFRSHMQTHIKVFGSEVDPIRWREDRSGWVVTLASGSEVSGLDNVQAFINMKNDYYSKKGSE